MCIDDCFSGPRTATAFADLNESGVCNTGQVMPNDIINFLSSDIINFLSLLTDGESSASAKTLENILMSLTICAFKIELPNRRCAAVSIYVRIWGLNFIVAQWLISTLGAQINYHILSTRTRTGWVKMWEIFLAKSRFLELQLSPLVRDILISPLTDLFGTSNRMPAHVEN